MKIIKRVRIRIGELQNIDLEVFKFALKELFKENSLEKVEVILVKSKAVFKCRRCKHVWRLDDVKLKNEEVEAIHFMPELIHAFISCPNCKSCDFDIIEGRGVWIENIEGI